MTVSRSGHWVALMRLRNSVSSASEESARNGRMASLAIAAADCDGSRLAAPAAAIPAAALPNIRRRSWSITSSSLGMATSLVIGDYAWVRPALADDPRDHSRGPRFASIAPWLTGG